MAWAVALALSSPLAHAQKIHFTVHGDSALIELGFDVRSAGDVNGDGRNDVIVGVPLDSLQAQQVGAARVYSGLDGAILHTLRGDAAQQQFGWSVSGLGDVNGDGRSDLLIGLPGASGGTSTSGRARILSGLDGSLLREWQGLVSSENFGGCVARCDDLDGDLVPDVLVGADNASTPNGRSGRVLLYSGATGLLIREFIGPAHNIRFGRCVRCAGDVDGDGESDIVVGAPWADPSGNNSGSAYVLSGATGLVLWQFHGDQLNDEFGHSVDGGDVDGDGRADIIVGTLTGNYVRVFSGATGQLLFSPTSAMPEDFGRSVAYLGDMDGDGLGDIAVGDRLGLLRGEAHVYSGDGRGMFVFATTFAQDHFGQSVAAAGDVDGDGRADLIVGGPRAAQNGAASGMARVFLGSRRIGTTYCNPAQPTTTGPPARIVAYGSVVASENCVTLSAFGVPRLAFGYFIGSQSQGVFQPGGSNGFICVSGPNAARFNQAGAIIQGPLGMLQVDLSAIPGNPVQVVLAGQTWNFQCWFRDGVSSNFTDAVSVAFQ